MGGFFVIFDRIRTTKPMRNVFFFLSSILILASCSNTLEDYDGVYEGIPSFWEASTPNDITIGQSTQIVITKTTQGFHFWDDYDYAGTRMHWFSNNGKVVWDTINPYSNGDVSEFHMEATIRGNELEYKNSEHYTYANGQEYTIHLEGVFDKQ